MKKYSMSYVGISNYYLSFVKIFGELPVSVLTANDVCTGTKHCRTIYNNMEHLVIFFKLWNITLINFYTTQ